MDIYKESIKIHRKYTGKITVDGKIKVRNQKDLSLVSCIPELCNDNHSKNRCNA